MAKNDSPQRGLIFLCVPMRAYAVFKTIPEDNKKSLWKKPK
ncbi:MAG: hypothetical protein ACT6FC_06865 [Methanosarcinaceae archaeon]